MWNPGGLLKWDEILDFSLHPWNLLYFVAASTILLCFLGGWAMSAALKMAAGRLRLSEELLHKVVGLRLDDEQPWQDSALKKDPAVSTFVSETLGSHRMLESRLKRYIGFEGELRRLEKAVSTDNRGEISSATITHRWARCPMPSCATTTSSSRPWPRRTMSGRRTSTRPTR